MKNLKDQILNMTSDVISNAVLSHLNGVEGDDVEVEMKKLIAYLDDICVPDNRVTVEELMKITNDEIIEKYKNIATEIYNGKEEEFGSEKMREIERVILLRTVDSKWMNHIDNMDHLKQGMGLRAFKQQDPVQAYQMEGSQMFDEMIQGIKTDTVKYIFHVQMEKAPERERVAKETSAVHAGADGDSKSTRESL